MTLAEKRIAEAAIDAGRKDRYEDIFQAVTDITATQYDQVVSTIEQLEAECFLLKRGGPAQNLAAGGKAEDIRAKAWYEPGQLWETEHQSTTEQ